MTLPDLIVQPCSWYIFCTVDVGGLSLAVVEYSAGFFCVFDSLFAVAIVIAFLFCVVSVLGAGDSISCLGMLVMFVVGLGLRCSLVLLYTLSLTFIRYVFGSLMGCGLLRTVPVTHMLLSVSLA